MTSRPKYNQYLTSNRRQVPAGMYIVYICSYNSRNKSSTELMLVDEATLNKDYYHYYYYHVPNSQEPIYNVTYIFHLLSIVVLWVTAQIKLEIQPRCV